MSSKCIDAVGVLTGAIIAFAVIAEKNSVNSQKYGQKEKQDEKEGL